MKGRLQHPMYTAAALAAANPVLLKGEVVYESDTLRRKVGDGSAAWNALPYESTGGSTPTGPFPGYRQIAGEGSIALDSPLQRFIDFTSPVDPHTLSRRHLVFDAVLAVTETDSELIFCLPAVFQQLVGPEGAAVVHFTTANLYLTDTVAKLFGTLGEFRLEGDFYTGCLLSTTPHGFFEPEKTHFKWHGIYLEVLPGEAV